MKRLMALLLTFVLLLTPAAQAADDPMEKQLQIWYGYLDMQEERMACMLSYYDNVQVFVQSREWTHLVRARVVHAGVKDTIAEMYMAAAGPVNLTAMETAVLTMQGKDVTGHNAYIGNQQESLYLDWVNLSAEQLNLYMPYYTESNLSKLSEQMQIGRERVLLDADCLCLMTNALYLMADNGPDLWAEMPQRWPNIAARQGEYLLTDEVIENALNETAACIEEYIPEYARLAGETANETNRMVYDFLNGKQDAFLAGSLPLNNVPVMLPYIPWQGKGSDFTSFYRRDDSGQLLLTSWNDPLDGYVLVNAIITSGVAKADVVSWVKDLKVAGAVCTVEQGDPTDENAWMVNLRLDTAQVIIHWAEGNVQVTDVGCQVYFCFEATAPSQEE